MELQSKSFIILFSLVNILFDKCLSVNLAEGEVILTSYIEKGKLSEAREASKVVNLKKNFGFPSYSGYFQIDKGAKCNSKMFFWFVPAAYNPADAPLILWHGGGPGSSGLTGAFVDHGPLRIDDDGQPQLRNYAWTLTRSMIFVDSPLNVGFSSHDDRPECYVRSANKTAEHVHEALEQFFKVFWEFGQNDFYIFTGSYGGKFAPAIGHIIHTKNVNSGGDSSPRINLKGICIASGFTDPLNQIDYGDFYYYKGLIDHKENIYFKIQENIAKKCILKEDYKCAFNAIEPLVIGVNGIISRSRNVTGISFPYNSAQEYKDIPKAMRNHVPFLNREDVKIALHAGKHKNYSASSNTIYYNFEMDIYQSMKGVVEELLDARSPAGEILYKFLIISSENDLIVPHTTIRNFVNALNWKGAGKFHSADTQQWNPDKEGEIVKGYLKKVWNLSYLFLKNCGHIWILDKPKLAFEIMQIFTKRGEQEFC